ncbi:MAG: L,D-transpeptidase family protein [Ruminococcus sp.]|nr:L,D-transpeptidase family protein [Ruminococcus sp.]
MAENEKEIKPGTAEGTKQEQLAKQIAKTMQDNFNDDDDISFSSLTPKQGFEPSDDDDYDDERDDEVSAPRKKTSRPATASRQGSRKKKKKSHAVDIVCGVMAVAIIGGVIGAYAYGKKSYDGVFLANTSINKVDVSGLSKEDALNKLSQEITFEQKISITKRDGTVVDIDLKDLDFSSNLSSAVDSAYDSQNHNMWFRSFLKPSSFEFDPDSQFNDKKLNAIIKNDVIDATNKIESKDAYIDRTDDGFEIVKEVVGNTIDKDKLGEVYDFIASEVAKGNYDISIADLDVYEQPQVLAKDLQDKCDSLNSIVDTKIQFDFVYEKATLKGSRFIDWLEIEEDGSYSVDHDEVVKYVAELADKYNTFATTRKFKSTAHGTVNVEPHDGANLYGWWLDDDGMADLVTELIEEGESTTVDPLFYTTPDGAITYEGNKDCWTKDDDIGDTYLELDLSAQHMYFYKKGKMVWETDVVTGMPTETRNTPEGVYKLWFKAADFRLKDSNADGSSWDTKVAYWNNISTSGIGIHDATWQPYFGGTLYQTNGSHGCVNVSLDAAKYVYENVPLNTPVVAFWD